MNRSQLANKIWESANKMRSKIEANEYKDYILGFIFYKFLSETEEAFLLKNDWDEELLQQLSDDDPDVVKFVQDSIGYFISYKNLFSTWIKAGGDFDAAMVTDALTAFNSNISKRHSKLFERIFDTLDHGLTKLGETSNARTKAIRNLIYLINDIPMDDQQGYDVLGFIYEYLIGKFAANAGKKAGEFYTPHEVSQLMSDIVAYHLRDREEIEIYDPTSGSGSLLITIGKSAARYLHDSKKIKYYAQEIKESTYNLTRMNLIMRGILVDNIVTRNGDTLEEDWPYFDESDPENTYEPLYVDAVVSNPPYSQNWDPDGKEQDPRFIRFGTAPKSTADYAFLLHDLYHLKPNGIETIVLPHGVLFRGGEEGKIRRNLIEFNHIDAIIGLPANIFYGTGIPTLIMVLKQKREQTDVLFIDASKGFEKQGTSNVLRARDIKKVVDAYIARRDIDGFCRVVSREEIRANDYNLNIPRYVDSSPAQESIDLWATMFGGIPQSELAAFDKVWLVFPHLKSTLFEPLNDAYCKLKVADIQSATLEHDEVKQFVQDFAHELAGFDRFIEEKLFNSLETVQDAFILTEVSDELFKRLANVPLLDRYQAYQSLHDDWAVIASDLDLIKSEGRAVIKRVEPNMVLKKKGGKDIEVQEGWKGSILPLRLVEEKHFASQLQELDDIAEKLSAFEGVYADLIEELPEDAKEKDFVNEDKFVTAEVNKVIKGKTEDDAVLKVLREYIKQTKVEKELKNLYKTKDLELENAAMDFIKNLSEDQALELLKAKWIAPINDNLAKLPQEFFSTLCAEINQVAHKYDSTFADIEQDISNAENELISMLDDLTGSDYDMAGIAEFKKLLKGE